MKNSAYKPEFISEQEIDENSFVVDAFSRQVRELFLISHKEHIGGDKEAVFASDAFKDFVLSKKGSVVYVRYPWLDTVVKTLPKEDYLTLKTNRNQDLITANEQVVLRDYSIAVFGLSVGSNVVMTATQAGISNSIVIADFDELDTTNLNRIVAGSHQIGINKAWISARRIYEDNPFADVAVHEDGASDALVEALLGSKTVQCIVDEVDDIAFKISCRRIAMKYGVPVVMITDNGDGVVLHVERYDLGLKTIFGKDPSYFDSLGNSLSRMEAGKMIIDTIVGGAERVDPAMMKSVQRVLSKELVSWSQLGSAALLGGVIATYMIKQIALKVSTEPDIRAYISPRSVIWQTHAQ